MLEYNLFILCDYYFYMQIIWNVCGGYWTLSLHATFTPTCYDTWFCSNNSCNDGALVCACINLGRNSVGLTASHLMTNVQTWWHTQVIYHCHRNLQKREVETVLTALITHRLTQRNERANGLYQPIVMKNRPSPFARKVKKMFNLFYKPICKIQEYQKSFCALELTNNMQKG